MDLTTNPKFFLSEKTGIQKTPKYTILDTTDYSAFDLTAICGIILSAARENTTFYSGGNFNDPDVTFDPVYNRKLDLPVSDNDEALYGVYTFNYKVRILNEAFASNSNQSINAIGASPFTQVTVPGQSAIAAALQALITAQGGQMLIKFLDSDGVELASSTLLTAAEDNVDLVLTFSSVTYSGFANIVYIQTQSFYTSQMEVAYCSQEWPTPDLVVTPDCISATIQVQDNTIIPSTDTYSRTVDFNFPRTRTGTPVADSLTWGDKIYIVGPSIWTGGYAIYLTGTVVRTLDDGLVLTKTLVQSKNPDIECADGLCCMRGCIEKIFNQYRSALTNGSANLTTLRDNVITISGYYMLYNLNVECGSPLAAQELYNSLKTYLQSLNCDCGCSDEPSGEPVEVFPLYASPNPNYIPISYMTNTITGPGSETEVPTTKAVYDYVQSVLNP